MNQELAVLGRAYQSYLSRARKLARIKPDRLAYFLASRLLPGYSPLLPARDQAFHNYQQFCPQSDWQVDPWWREHLRQQAIMAINIHKLGTMNKNWLKRHVQVKTPQDFAQFCHHRGGGIIFTYHLQHQHHLCAVCGMTGQHIYPLAAPPQSSPLYACIAKDIDALHRHASAHYSGGNYIFFTQGQQGMRQAIRAINQGAMVVSLSDNAANNRHTCNVPFFNGQWQVASGMMALAHKKQLPVWCAALYWLRSDQFALHIKALDTTMGVDSLARQYMAFLQELLERKPFLWEGWQWPRN